MKWLRGFSLVELLVVVALIAIVGAGVALTYGREMILQARQQTTTHEMATIRDAFRRFYADNLRSLRSGLYDAGHREHLPSSAFRRTFRSSSVQSCTENNRLYGMLEFFERYGLWFLLQPSVNDRSRHRDELHAFAPYNPIRGEGWQGPYLSPARLLPYTEIRGEMKPVDDSTPDSSVRLPQIATQYENGIYRVLYFEHCEDENDATKPIFRRLLLVCAQDGHSVDSAEKLRRYAGNRRDRPSSVRQNDAFPLNMQTGAIEPLDSDRGIAFTELLNLDTQER